MQVVDSPVDVIVYHADCPDGFCAAFIVRQKYPEALLVPAKYGKPVDRTVFVDNNVVVVDFSWSREETIALHDLAKWMVVLDHHKTAEAELAGLDFCIFDMERSGAQMAWDWTFPNHQIRPWFVEFVADRDLWQWKLPDSKQVNAYLMILPYEQAAWAALFDMTFQQAAVLGTGARAQVEHYVDLVCAEARLGTWEGYKVFAVNAPYVSISDVGNQLCQEGAEIGVGWFVRGDGQMQFSLRSIGDLDVSALAKRYNDGGGHRNAAGFQVAVDEGFAMLQDWGVIG